MSDIASEPGADAPAPDTSAAPEAPQFDMSALADTLQERFAPQFDEIRQRLEPQEEPEPEPDPYAPLADMGYSEEEAAATRQALDSIVEARVRQIMGPLEQSVNGLASEAQLDRALGQLERQYPALQDDKVAEPVIRAVQEYAQRTGDQRALGDPWIYEQVYLAQVGRERASQEQPAGRPGAELEQPGGASPPEPEVDVNDQILGAGNGNSDFWGWGGPR